MRAHASLIALLAAMSLALLSCDFSLPGAAPLASCSVTTSQQAADRLIQRIQHQNVNSGKTVTISATSEEVSSLLFGFLQAAKDQTPSGVIPLDNPKVCFNQNGTMSVSGGLLLDPKNPIDAQIVARASVNKGKVAFQIQQLQLGPISAPPELTGQLETYLNTSLNQYIDQVTLTDIKITNGQISLTGKVQ